MELERRYWTIEGLEFREDGEDEARTVHGLAVPFNRLSSDLGGFQEKIDPGALDRSLRENPDVVMLWQHDAATPITRATATEYALSLEVKRSGLYFAVDERAFSEAQRDLLRRGVVKEMSFGFVTREDSWDEDRKPFLRTVTDMDLHEISPVTWPAYNSTQVAVRSAQRAGLRLTCPHCEAPVHEGVCEPHARRLRARAQLAMR